MKRRFNPMTERERDALCIRIATALGWSRRDVNSFSFATLGELVRHVDPELAGDLSMIVSDGRHIYLRVE